jgi:hypothetical protein
MGRRGPAPAKNAAHKRARNVRAAMRRYRRRHRSRINAQRNERNARKQQLEGRLSPPPPDTSLFTTNRIGLQRPSLYFMDTNGVLHTEDTRSAEEVIRDFCGGTACRAREDQ